VSSTLAEEHDKPRLSPIPTEYRRHQKVFSEEAAQRFPESRIWDHAIELKPGAPSSLPGKIYALSQLELQELAKFVKEHLAKGYIRPSKKSLRRTILLHQKEGRKTTPCARLPTTKRMDDPQPLPLTPHPTTNQPR